MGIKGTLMETYCTSSDVGGDRQALWGFRTIPRSPLPAPSLPRTTSDVVKDVSPVRDSWMMIERSRLIFAIASEVEEAQWQEAASKNDKISVICGRTVGSISQHFSASSHTSPERPKISRFGGRRGRWPAKTSPGTRREGMRENGRSCAKTCRAIL